MAEMRVSIMYTIDYRICRSVATPDTLEYNCLYAVASRVFIDELVDNDKITDWEMRLIQPNRITPLFALRERAASDVARQMDFRGVCEQCINR